MGPADRNDLNSRTLWCPSCGAEYRAGFDECSDCHVALTSTRPEPQPRRLEDPRDHDVVQYEVGDLHQDQRNALELLLRGAGIAHDWEPGHLVVSRTVESEIDNFMDLVGAEPVDASKLADEAESYAEEPASSDGEIAGRGRRLAGYIVDGVVLSPLSFLLFGAIGRAPGTVAAMFVASGAYRISCVALWGRTPGKLIVGTRVVSGATHALPGWDAAAKRWATEAAGGLPEIIIAGGSVGLAARLLGLAWPIVVYGALMLDPLNRGLHDRVAATVVICD